MFQAFSSLLTGSRESLEMGLLENGKVSTKVPPKEVSAGRTCSMSFSVI